MTNIIEDFFRINPSSLPHAEYRDDSKRTLYAVGAHFAPCNGVIEKGNTLTPEVINETIALFKQKELPFVWWTEDPILSKYGFQFGGKMKGIALDLAKMDLPSSNGIKQVVTEQELLTFNRISEECFGYDPKTAQEFLRLFRSAMEKKTQTHFLAYLNNVPVGIASLFTAPKTSGIWNLATLPEYRCKGIATSLCSEALKLAKQKNYKETTAVLMPKGLAAGVFSKLGFKEVGDLPFYVYGNQLIEK